jgi:hypothetical protein
MDLAVKGSVVRFHVTLGTEADDRFIRVIGAAVIIQSPPYDRKAFFFRVGTVRTIRVCDDFGLVLFRFHKSVPFFIPLICGGVERRLRLLVVEIQSLVVFLLDGFAGFTIGPGKNRYFVVLLAVMLLEFREHYAGQLGNVHGGRGPERAWPGAESVRRPVAPETPEWLSAELASADQDFFLMGSQIDGVVFISENATAGQCWSISRSQKWIALAAMRD